MQQHIPTSNKKKVLLQYDHQRRNESTGRSRECIAKCWIFIGSSPVTIRYLFFHFDIKTSKVKSE